MVEERTPSPADARPARAVPVLLRPFRVRSYRRLAVAMVLNMFALGVWTVALVWEVIRLGGGPTQLSVVATASAVGLLAPALVAGVVADRVPQKTVLLAVAGAETLGTAGVAVLSAADLNSLPVLAGVALLLGLASAFYYPAYSAWLPALVPATDLVAVNGFEGMVRPALNQALGPAVAGALIAATAPASAAGLAAACSAAGLAVLVTVPRTAVRRDPDQPAGGSGPGSVLRDVREGIAYMVRTPWLLAKLLFASLLVLVAMGPLEVLIPFLIKDGLGGGAHDHALVLAAFGVGSAIGSLVAGSRPLPRRYLSLMILGWGFCSVPLAVMGLVHRVWMIAVCALVIGLLMGAPTVIWGTLLQRRVPPHLLGRISSLDFFVSLSLMPLSMALAGPVAELIGLRTTFLVAGLVPPVLAVVALLWARLPQDELAHPLDGDEERRGASGPAPA